MKKLVILGTALLALNAIASEAQLKAGYDLSRKYKNGDGLIEDSKLKKGPTLGLEYIFDNQGEFEWGLGAEYKFSSNSGSLKYKETNSRIMKTAPLYALGKFNLITTAAGNDALYVLGRAGYGFASEDKNFGADISGGLYAALGLGTEFGPVSLEALVERQNIKYTYSNGIKDKDKVDTFGLRLGYRLGNLVNDRQPKIVERVVRETVTVTTPAPKPPVKQPIVTGKTVALPFSCTADERKCIIRGFRVDGRVPNETEAQDLRSIAEIINQFAEGGSIDFIGHTDSTGSDAYNQKLSVARAQNVARLLREYGLKNSVSSGAVTGRGESQPIDTNNTVEGRYNNRRVELFFNNVDFTNVNFTN